MSDPTPDQPSLVQTGLEFRRAGIITPGGPTASLKLTLSVYIPWRDAEQAVLEQYLADFLTQVNAQLPVPDETPEDPEPDWSA